MEGNSPPLPPIKRRHSQDAYRRDDGSPSKQGCFSKGRAVEVDTNPGNTATTTKKITSTVGFSTFRTHHANEQDQTSYEISKLKSIHNHINTPHNIADLKLSKFDDGFVLSLWRSGDRNPQLIVDTRSEKCPLTEDIRAELNDCLLEEYNNREKSTTDAPTPQIKMPALVLASTLKSGNNTDCEASSSSANNLQQDTVKKNNFLDYVRIDKSVVEAIKKMIKSELVNGKVVHTCTICNESGRSLCLSIRHAEKHSREKPYICSDCGLTYSRLSGLNKHIKATHFGIRYNCTNFGCTKKYANVSDLNSHMREHDD